MSQPRFRVRVLCEDRRAERFLRRLCRRYGIERPEIVVAPAGAGSAVNWVITRYPDWVRQRRSKKHQKNLGLLVHIDGDSRGVDQRKAELDASLQAKNLAKRQANESIAVFVPTWCIETWLLHLSHLAQPAESVQIKRSDDSQYRRAMQVLEEQSDDIIRKAVCAWPSSAIPSLRDAQEEARRIGLG